MGCGRAKFSYVRGAWLTTRCYPPCFFLWIQSIEQMAKIELDDLVLGVSPLTETVFAGVLDKRSLGKRPLWLHKKDVTSDVLRCIIEKVGEGMVLNVSAGDEQWEISVVKLKAKAKRRGSLHGG